MTRTATIRGLTIGDGTTRPWEEGGPVGLGLAPPDTSDEPRIGGGSVASFDRQRLARITLPFHINAADEAAAWIERDQVLAAFRPADGDIELELLDRVRFGRPRGVALDLASIDEGWVPCVATFEALDPLGYGEEDSTGAESGTFTVDNVGNAPTDRATLTIVGNGSAPTIQNTTDANKTIRFGQTITGTHTVDLRSRTVLDGSDEDAYGLLAPTNQWFDLLAGENSLTLTGATSVDVAWRPAWY